MVITGISSMATRALLAEWAAAYAQRSQVEVRIESVGGVDAAKRVAAGEAFDIVVLASDALDKLAAAGAVQAAGRVDVARSQIAIAVRAGAEVPALDTAAALRAAVLAAPSVSMSTGPSGVYLTTLFQRWGIAEQLAARIVQAPPGVPVGSLVARGDVALGFQQLSELMDLPGITVAGLLPPEVAFTTVFAAAVTTASAQVDAAMAALADLSAPDNAGLKRRHGMEPG